MDEEINSLNLASGDLDDATIALKSFATQIKTISDITNQRIDQIDKNINKALDELEKSTAAAS